MDGFLHNILFELLEKYSGLFPKSIQTQDNIRNWYQTYRSFRRTSNSVATEQGVSDPDKRMVIRWRKVFHFFDEIIESLL
jgi:hypothetical protein